MTDAFEEIQAIKIKRNCLREKLQKRKRERHELFTLTTATSISSSPNSEPYRSPGNYAGHVGKISYVPKWLMYYMF